MDEAFEAAGGENWILMPLLPYSPSESLFELAGTPPHAPSAAHPLGTDDRARDVLARLAYGFNISITFAVVVLIVSYALGVSVGAIIGYFGGKPDILGQRVIEIWSSLPFLYTIIIVSSIVVPVNIPGRYQLLQPSFWLLVAILSAFGWMGITYYVRGEFYREKAKDYVGAAIAIGTREREIMFRHILPNSLTPVISFAPFAIVAHIASLVALDFLGFGLPAPTPSWGELIGQGVNNLTKWWLVLFPLGAVFVTLLLIVFIGEAIREAFDPREYSRIR
jgi:microcin C transport system permease protein